MAKEIKDIPRVIIPEFVLPLKFVQLYVNGKPYIIFERLFSHRDILRHILDRFDLKYGLVRDVSPELKGENNTYEAVGMGRASMSENELTIRTDSESIVYGLRFNKKHFEEVKPYFLKGLEVILN